MSSKTGGAFVPSRLVEHKITGVERPPFWRPFVSMLGLWVVKCASDGSEREFAMDIIGPCLSCFPESGCFLVNSGMALALLVFAICRANSIGSAANANPNRG